MITPGAYTGFRFPDGAIPRGIRGNQQQQENDYLNDETYLSYMWRLYDLAVSVFEWKNLPAGINERMIERWLLANGMCLFVYDEEIKNDPEQRSPEGFAMLRMVMNGAFDIYNLSLIHISEPTRQAEISYAVFCLKKKKRNITKKKKKK